MNISQEEHLRSVLESAFFSATMNERDMILAVFTRSKQITDIAVIDELTKIIGYKRMKHIIEGINEGNSGLSETMP